ncbi:MAG: YaaA family protein, partial [Pseudomonadota bacterium]
MLILISPAKTLDFSNNELESKAVSNPVFLKEAEQLVTILKKYSIEDIASLMKLSPALSKLNYDRFKEFDKAKGKPAIFAYKGDVYEGFELDTYKDPELDFADQHLRIISGLYGLLKPLDLIKPYRLEMSINLPNKKGKNLYQFWGDKITDTLNYNDENCIINL